MSVPDSVYFDRNFGVNSRWNEIDMSGEDIKYIRADLIVKLKPYLNHLDSCEIMLWDPMKESRPRPECTCGLEKVKEVLE